MLMATFIHVLEGITVLLVGAMSLQVFKCYAEFIETGQFGRADLSMHINSKLATSPASYERSEPRRGADLFRKHNPASSTEARRVNKTSPAVVARAQHLPRTSSTTVEILDDYIGEFFTDAEPPKTLHNIPTLEARVSDDMVSERFIAQRNEVDEEVILVAEQSVEQTPQSTQVMSNKVVRAMLDEARTVVSN